MKHDHATPGLVIGCPACITETRHAENETRWASAPIRKLTWKCDYSHGKYRRTLYFTITKPCPVDANEDEIDERYIEITSEEFVMALPEIVSMRDTQQAIETMSVMSIAIGPVVTPLQVVPEPQPGLFD